MVKSNKNTLLEALKDPEVQELFKAQVREAVAEAMAAKDKEIKELRAELDDTKAKLNELEQYSRRLCLNVSGVPEGPNENTNQIVTDLAKMAGVELTPGDIDSSHRVGAPGQGKTRSIIVRFAHYPARQTLYNARRELRKPRSSRGSTVSAETANNVFISDNLTRENQLILYKARQLKKEQKVAAAWSDVGKLKVRLEQGGKTHVIRTMSDLTKLVSPGSAAANPQGSASSTPTQVTPQRPS